MQKLSLSIIACDKPENLSDITQASSIVTESPAARFT